MSDSPVGTDRPLDDQPGDLQPAAVRQRGSREVYANAWMRLREDEIEYASGARSIYGVIERNDFVTIVPYERSGFWLVQQYRYPLGRRVWEFPQGGWPQGKAGTIDELAAAELVEETGLSARRLVHLGRLQSSPGLMAQCFDVFLATGLSQGVPRRETSESDMVHRWFARAQLQTMIRTGEFADCHSVAALTLLELSRS